MKKLLLGVALLGLSASASATGRTAMYEVTITNITKAQTFTPQLVVTHSSAAFDEARVTRMNADQR